MYLAHHELESECNIIIVIVHDQQSKGLQEDGC